LTGNTAGMVHKRIQKMTSTGTVNKPVEKKPLSQVELVMDSSNKETFITQTLGKHED